MVTLPHPANFALHKLLIMNLRPQPEKQAKDKEAAIRILNTLVAGGQADTLREAFDRMPKRWQGKVKKQLTDITERHLVEILE